MASKFEECGVLNFFLNAGKSDTQILTWFGLDHCVISSKFVKKIDTCIFFRKNYVLSTNSSVTLTISFAHTSTHSNNTRNNLVPRESTRLRVKTISNTRNDFFTQTRARKRIFFVSAKVARRRVDPAMLISRATAGSEWLPTVDANVARELTDQHVWPSGSECRASVPQSHSAIASMDLCISCGRRRTTAWLLTLACRLEA